MVAHRIEEPLTDEERSDIEARVQALDAALKWLNAHYEALIRQHPEQWVAVSADGVVAVDTNFDALVARIDADAVRQGRIITEFLPAKPLNLIL